MGHLDARQESLEEAVLAAYVDRHVGKRLKQYLMAGTNDLEGFRQLVQAVVQVTFSLLLSQGNDELEDARNIRCQVEMTTGYTLSNQPVGLGHMDLGRTSALGCASADAGPVVRIESEISAEQAVRLYRARWVLPHISRVLDSVIPLYLSFELSFRMHPADGLFRLATSESDGRDVCILGVTTGLKHMRHVAV